MEELKVSPIRNGTVIDHINRGQALNVLRVLGVNEDSEEVVSIAMNVKSKKLGKKDIVKLEGKELSTKETAVISLISPEATLNLIRNYEVKEKKELSPPRSISGILNCPNPNCITNAGEPVKTSFEVKKNNKDYRIRCSYCGNFITGKITEYL